MLVLRKRLALVLSSALLLVACAHAEEDGVGTGGAASSSSTSGATTGSATTTGGGATTGAGGGAAAGSGGAATTSTTSTTSGSTTSTTSGSTTSTTTGGGPGAVFFSEYVEGTGNNKALEIVNTTASSVALGDCLINRYQNGSSTPTAPAITLNAVSLGPGQVFVLCHSSFAMTTLCDQTSTNVSHTGNDAIVLECGGVIEDSFGVVGQDMVWGTAPTASQDATLRRKCSVMTGDTNTADAFDPASEWDGFPVDTFGDLGQYVCP